MTFKAETGSKGFVKNRKIHLALKKKKISSNFQYCGEAKRLGVRHLRRKWNVKGFAAQRRRAGGREDCCRISSNTGRLPFYGFLTSI